jgi:hypothetical protein
MMRFATIGYGTALLLSTGTTFFLERVELEPHKQAYFGRIRVGSPAQEFTVLFDTGSGNVLLPSKSCKSEPCGKHVRYDRGASTTGRDIQVDGSDADPKAHRDGVSVGFGTGSVTGVFVEDEVCVGALCTKQAFVEATEETTEPFTRYAFDGVLGLALPEMSESPDFNFVHTLKAKGALNQGVFGLYLADSGPSALTFGGPDPSRFQGDVMYKPVTGDAGYWQVDMHGLTVDGAPLGGRISAVLDSGTSQLAGPTDLIVAVVERIDVAKDCSNLATLPQLGISFGDHILALDPEDYVDKVNGGCELALMPMDVPPPDGPLFVLGEPFLRKFYTVYDADERRVGFAHATRS